MSNRTYEFARFGAVMAAVLIVGLGIGAARFSYLSLDASAWVTHTTLVIDEVRSARMLLGAAVGAATAQGSAAARVNGVLEQVERVRQLTSDNPWQQRNAAEFKALFNTPGHDVNAPLESSVVATANVILDRMQGEEYGLLIDRSKRQTDSTRLAAIVVSGLCLALLALGIFSSTLAHREFRRRAAAETTLLREKRELTRYTHELSLVSAGSELIQAAQDETHISEAVARVMRDLLPGSFGYFGLVSPSLDLVEVCGSWGEGTVPGSFAPSDCVALQLGRHVHRSQTLVHVGCKHVGQSVGDYVCMPVRSATGHLGILHVQTIEILDRQRAESVALFTAHVALGLTNLRMREALRRQTLRDSLTGLFNRRYFDETLLREISSSARTSNPVSVLMLDVDHFKAFNDTYGHAAGDEALRIFSGIMRSSFRDSDVVSRYGGEEFAVILSGVSLADAYAKAESFRLIAEQAELTSDGRSIGRMTTSIGIASCPEFGVPDELLKAADNALYHAKRSGRNTTYVCSSLPGNLPAIPNPLMGVQIPKATI